MQYFAADIVFEYLAIDSTSFLTNNRVPTADTLITEHIDPHPL